MYQALYRKWRPRTFADVSDQNHITETLKRQVVTGRLSHAYLFVGTRGTGKTSCAKIMSRAINCEHPVDGEPCNKCPSCIGIENGSILDVVELDAASNNGVDNVRALREEAIYSPASVKKRVYIVDEVHMLSGSAFNALLKILEEPPEHLVFILATTELHKVPATILSRCQRFSFKRLSTPSIAARLKYVADQEGFGLTDGAAELLARLADGAMRDGLSLLDQCAMSGTVDEERVMAVAGLTGASETAALFECFKERNTPAALKQIEKLYSGGRDMASLLNELSDLVRDILVYKLGGAGGDGLLSGSFDTGIIKKFSSMSASRLLNMAQQLSEASVEMSRTSNRRFAAEMCVIKMCDESLASGSSAIVSRIERLEDMISHGVPAAKPAEPANAAVPETDDDVPWVPDEPEDDDVPWVYEDDPVYDEAAEPMREAAPQKAEVDGNFWDRILAGVKPEIAFPPFAFLSDMTDVTPVMEDDTLFIKVKSVFTPSAIDVPEVMDPLRRVAQSVFGRAVAVKVVLQDEDAQKKRDKLDSLAKFGNIEFK